MFIHGSLNPCSKLLGLCMVQSSRIPNLLPVQPSYSFKYPSVARGFKRSFTLVCSDLPLCWQNLEKSHNPVSRGCRVEQSGDSLKQANVLHPPLLVEDVSDKFWEIRWFRNSCTAAQFPDVPKPPSCYTEIHEVNSLDPTCVNKTWMKSGVSLIWPQHDIEAESHKLGWENQTTIATNREVNIGQMVPNDSSRF